MNINEIKLLTKNDVCKLLTISKSSLWRIENKDPTFPHKVQIGESRVAYRQSEILKWLKNQ